MAIRQTETLNNEAAVWFARLRNSGASAESDKAFIAWVEADPARAVAYARVEATWERAERLTAYGRAAAQPRAAGPEAWMSRRAAATALITTGAGALAIGAGALTLARGRKYTTEVGQRRTILLTDGSKVTLNTNSQIMVAYHHDRRDLKLERGEALFDVAKDPSRPFIVAAGDATVRAVGTEFNIRLKEQVAEVTVTEGVVAVNNASAAQRVTRLRPTTSHVKAGAAVVIAPGAVANVNLDYDAMRTRLAWRQGMIELRGETLEQAVAEFNRYSDHKLVIGDPKIASIRVGGEFGTTESDKFIRALKTTFDVRAVSSNSGDTYLLSAS
jgi:transmembrane sensor